MPPSPPESRRPSTRSTRRFAPPFANLPAATKAYHASQVFLRFVPEGRILTWDNARIATTQW